MCNQADHGDLIALIDSTKDLVWSVDIDFGLVTFNHALEHNYEINFGTRAERGKGPEDLLPPAMAADWPPLYKRALSNGSFRAEYAFVSGQILELALNPIIVDGKASGIAVFAWDITERESARKARWEAEQKFRDLFDNAPEGTFQATLEGLPLIVNSALARMLGYESPEDFLATAETSVHDVWVDPHERTKYVDLLKTEGDIRGYECRFRCKNSASIWVAVNARLSHAADGKTLISEGFVENLTERKRALDGLIDGATSLNENEFLALAGSSSLDIDSDTATWSKGLYRIAGREPSTPAPRYSEQAALYTAESWALLDNAVKRAIATGEPYDLELQVVRPDGALRWARARGAAVRNENGRVYRLLSSLQDVTERRLTKAMIGDSEELYRATFEQAAVGIVHTSFEGRFLRCNPRFAEIIGYPIEDVPGLRLQQISAEEANDAVAWVLQQLGVGDAGSAKSERRYLRKDGTFTWVNITTSTRCDTVGRPVQFISVVEDINARKRVEERLEAAQQCLRNSEARYRTVFQTSLDGIAISQLDDGTFIDVNQAFLNTVKYEREEVIGRTSTELGVWPDVGIRRELAEVLHRDSCFRDVTIPFRRKNGENFWMKLSSSVIQLDGNSCVLSFTRDTSNIKAAEERIKDLIFYDPLTHLPNRRLLLDRLQLSLGTRADDPPKRALLFIDLDEFSRLNDTIGHQAGDLLIQDVAGRLTASVRRADTVARCGGDEFAVILEDLSAVSAEAFTQAALVAEKIHASLRQPYFINGREFHTTASIGMVVFENEPDPSHEVVLQQSEIAMHEAKAAGRNTTRCFTPALKDAVCAFITLEGDLHKAVKAKEFLLYYQPQVDSTGLIGAEALIRWQHPKRGLLAPSDFILLAEETGLILPLGDWTLEAACAQIASWANRKQPASIVVAVNLSACQFNQPDLVKQVLKALDRTGASPQKLRLELTETMMVGDIEDIIAKMTVLKSHGLSFSLDDFGTGYSSLAYLKRLPLDQLKIDRSFVRDITVDTTSGLIAKTIISLSHAMGLSVIAEGIESEEQRDFLAGLGCHAFQGYLFSPPLSSEEFERSWLHSIPDIECSTRK